METAEIRRRWLRYFEERGHTVLPSASLLLDDPTLLFVNAGMVPFKPYFIGELTPPWLRATSVQKCVRTLDIEEVGKTTRHGTFFQMNGNFSFGDYFKEGAIELGWELVTRPQADGGYGFDEAVLYASVYEDDDEAAGLWKRVAGLSDDRIIRLGKKDNYWHMGVPGPGGPCSEILIDRGPEFGAEGDWDAGDRYLEFWNLVFMQDSLSAVRSKADFDLAGPLPRKNIDTGMGLERVAFLLQGVDNLYEIDQVFPVIQHAEELSGRRYRADHEDDVRMRVVADHVRSSLMVASEGITPGNEGRGYVLRRLMRRVVRSMRLLGVDEPVLPGLLEVSKDAMKESYPELEEHWERIRAVGEAEEHAFRQTLRAGTQIFDTAAQQTRATGSQRLSGADAFKLHDTYGFPIDLTLEMATEQGLSVDREGFTRLMQEQRQRAKDDAKAKKSGHADLASYRALAQDVGGSTFTGYDETRSESTIRGLLVDGERVQAVPPGTEVEVVLDRTPFYAEGGGQIGDTGRIVLGDGTELEVLDVQSPVSGLPVHRALVRGGEAHLGDQGQSVVDLERRLAISRAHTATHMVHKAIREILGDSATQMGSENRPGRLRFDFPNPASVPPSVLAEVEERVNAVLVDDLAVTAEVMTQDEAIAAGAMALFGEKYGDAVRVVSVGDWARELCGGTHTQHTGQLGLVKILHESSIGAGVRRVEALVGADAFSFLAREHLLVTQLSEALKARPEELPERVEAMVARLRDVERELDKLRRSQLLSDVGSLLGEGRDAGGVTVFTFAAPAGTDAAGLRELVIDGRGRHPAEAPVVVVGAAADDGKVSIVAAASPAAVAAGAGARLALQAVLPHVSGRGGGRDDVAQGGGTDPAGIAAGLAAVDAAVAGRS